MKHRKHRPSKEQKRRRIKRQESKRRQKKDKSSRFNGNLIKKLPEETKITAPVKLSLTYENVVPTLKFIQELKAIGLKEKRIFLDLTDVEYIGEGGIAMLMSVVSDFQRRDIYCRGTKPSNENARNVLERSGFFKQMLTHIDPQNKLTYNDILTTGTTIIPKRKVYPQIHQSMCTVWGEKGRCPALYSSIGELIKNSVDHAFTEDDHVVWHLGVSHFEEQHLVKFSFVDNGAGIIQTYKDRDASQMEKFYDFFQSYPKVLKSAFEDGIKSSTGLSWRGTGLPTIFEMYSDNIVKRFVVISNKCYLDFDRNLFEKISVPFDGTYYYWEIDASCEKASFSLT